MNINKVIFGIIGAILLASIVYVILNLNNDSGTKVSKKTSGDFTIWMIGDKQSNAKLITDHFKKVYPKYSNTNIVVESFENYDDYSLSLVSAILLDKAPDIFVLNNNEKNSVFINQITGVNPDIVNPNDFRKKFKSVFVEDLIINNGEKGKEEQQEFLMGIPVGYETLGIFYNRRYVKDSELGSLSGLNNIVAKLKTKNPGLIPIGIGNGSTVYNAPDIVTQFFMLEDNVKGLKDLTGIELKQGLSTYLLYGDVQGYNSFNSRFAELSNMGQNSIDLFSKGETFMVVGYPSLINEIADKGFSKTFLLASPFPHYYSGNGKTLVNYNYFVVNKDTKKYDLANDFLGYIASDIGAENYLENFKFYLPALLSLESDKLEDRIHDNYNIVLENFFNPDYELSSFDKGIKNLYDDKIISILDNSSNYESAFMNFRNMILCKADKIATLEKLSKSCE